MRKEVLTILILTFLITGIAGSTMAAYTGGNTQQYDVGMMIFENSAPAKPEKPAGPTGGFFDRVRVGQEKSYTSTTTDPEGHDIAYKWDFDDGTITDWSQTKPSGAVSWPAEHMWNETGVYNVKVKARDDPDGNGDPVDGKESYWSDSLAVTVLGKLTLGRVQILVFQVYSKVMLYLQRIYFNQYQRL